MEPKKKGKILLAFLKELQTNHFGKILDLRANREYLEKSLERLLEYLKPSNTGKYEISEETKDLILWYCGIFTSLDKYELQEFDRIINIFLWEFISDDAAYDKFDYVLTKLEDNQQLTADESNEILGCLLFK